MNNIKFDYLYKIHTEIFNKIINDFNIILDTDEIEVINDCRSIEQAIEVFNESLSGKYTVIWHENIEKIVKTEILGKYRCLSKDTDILAYIDLESYFEDICKDTMENTFYKIPIKNGMSNYIEVRIN